MKHFYIFCMAAMAIVVSAGVFADQCGGTEVNNCSSDGTIAVATSLSFTVCSDYYEESLSSSYACMDAEGGGCITGDLCE